MRKILLAILCLFLLSCSGNSSNVGQITLQTGTDGLNMQIVKKGFTKEVSEGERIFVTLEMRNEGFSDITNGKLLLTLEPDFMELESWDLPEEFRTDFGNSVSFNLKGKTLAIPRGELQVVRAIIQTKDVDSTLKKVDSRFIINACYAYSTILSKTICIDTDPFGLGVAKKSCDAKDISLSSQGAPIAIKKIEQKVLPGNNKDEVRLEFSIYADNVGEGTIIDRNRYSQICSGQELVTEDFNSISLDRVQFSGYEYSQDFQDMDCTNPMIKTKDGYYSRCVMKDGIPKSKLTFETPLIVQLSYGYKQIISEDVSILDTGITLE